MAIRELDNDDGQMHIDDLFEPSEKLVAVSRIFARARKDMSLAEQKCFVYALSELRFTEDAKSDSVLLDKKKLAEIIGVQSDQDHLSEDVYRAVKFLPRNSFIEISEKDLGLYESGTMINRVQVRKLRSKVLVEFNRAYMPLFTGLTTNYITLWSGDIFSMTSRRSVQFYEYLRQITDTREKTNTAVLGVRALKSLFSIPAEGKGSYVREHGGFDRTQFERRIIEPICEDLLKCRMITLLVQADGKPYAKIKKGGRVQGYEFSWVISEHPAVATAAKVKEIQERVDKNPQVLKVAKDIVDGEKKPKTKKSYNRFNDFPQRKYEKGELDQFISNH